MKQVKLYDDVHKMLDAIVEHAKDNGNFGATKQSIVNGLIMEKHKKVTKLCAKK